MSAITAMLTDEDVLIAHRLRMRHGYRSIHAAYRNSVCEQADAELMRKLLRTRKNNRSARAFVGLS